jgi:hypothetical protein
MNVISADPFAALVHLRIEELRQEAAGHESARAARRGARRGRPSWPSSIVIALRDSFARGNTSRAAVASRSLQPCPTC